MTTSLAVQLYSQVDPSLNPNGIPGNWPCQVLELQDGQSAPDNTWQIMTVSAYNAWLAANQADYNTWAAAQAAAAQYTTYALAAKNSIIAAMAFGRDLIAEYGGQNVASGFNLTQLQTIITATAGVQAAIMTGSLYMALEQLALVPVDGVLITTEKITYFRNKLQAYLGLPLT